MITSNPLPGPDLFSARDSAEGIADSNSARTSRADEERAGEVLSREMSLFDLDEALCLLMDSAVEEAAANNGEIPQELQQALLDYCEAFGQKVDNIARYIRFQEFEAANAESEIERLKRRKAAAENRVTRLKGILKYFMETRGIRSLKGRLNSISLRKNSQDSLILTDTTKLPSEFWRVSLVLNAAEWEEVLLYLPDQHAFRTRFGNPEALKREPDNGSLRAALAAGHAIEGAELRRENHIRIT
jgi:hypothetical protein